MRTWVARELSMKSSSCSISEMYEVRRWSVEVENVEEFSKNQIIKAGCREERDEYRSSPHDTDIEQLHRVQSESEDRPLIHLTFYGDHAVMGRCDLFDNRKAKAGSV